MDELVTKLELFEVPTTASTPDFAFVLGLSFILLLGVTWVYRQTHRGMSYSQTHAQTLVVLGMVVALIMLIIGSSLARAFSLVGALSIIRFRNAVKETRDVGFVFLAMAIGMACGTRLYLLATFAAASLSAVVYLMHAMDFFSRNTMERILRVRLPADRDHQTALGPIFRVYADQSRLLSIESVNGGACQELTFAVTLSGDIQPQRFLEALRTVNDSQKVTLLLGEQDTDS